MTQLVEAPVRLLVVARQSFSVSDAGLENLEGVESVQVVRRPKGAEAALTDGEANVALIDTGFTDRRGFDVMSDILAAVPTVAVLALTQDPPTYEEVALATGAGRGDSSTSTPSHPSSRRHSTPSMPVASGRQREINGQLSVSN